VSHGEEETIIPNLKEVNEEAEGAATALVQSPERYVLRLFVTGSTPKSVRAITNLRAILEEYLSGRYTLEIVDLYQQPELARQNNLIAAPTLIKSLPDPVRRVIGDMSDEEQVLLGLDFEPE
jgi:circadian clock protein KaiB